MVGISMTDSLVIFALIFQTFYSGAISCSHIHADISFQITGAGFHRRMFMSANLTSEKRLINCQLIYHFQIPGGAYIDVDQLNRQSMQTKFPPKHCLTANHFDIEKAYVPDKSPQLTPAIFHSIKFASKSFLLNDQLEFPIHLRYHKPDPDGKGFAIVEFGPPRLFLRCEQNDTLLSEPSCKQQVEKVPCECKNQRSKCQALRIHSNLDMANLNLHIPVGDERLALFVTVTTFAVAFLGTFTLLWELFKRAPTNGESFTKDKREKAQ